MRFERFIMVDWSGGNDRGPTPKRDAIWAGTADHDPVYLRNRQLAESWLADQIDDALSSGVPLCLGFDFPFGYPTGFAAALTGTADPLALWDWFESRIEDAPKANNRFDLAGQINRQFGGAGPFWGNALKREVTGLPRGLAGYRNPFPERRKVEKLAKGSFTCWQLAGAGAVGSQVIMGLPVLARLRRRFPGQISVWPFEPLNKPVALVEIWPSLRPGSPPDDMIRDAWQVRNVADWLARLAPDDLTRLLTVDAPEEGWILGVPAALEPPVLRNDCFALPAGVYWTPVDAALNQLRSGLAPVTGVEDVASASALGRILAEPAIARRSHPPAANSAVDGYGFAGGLAKGAHVLPLVQGRAAAGAPFGAQVPAGSALRILTGATLPKGVDTVVLEEDVSTDGNSIAVNGPLKPGANARKAGEDVIEGRELFRAGRCLGPADLALLAATGVATATVRRPLRVAVLSTGDEIAEPGAEAEPGQIFDANRPMLLSLIARFGHVPVDLGRAADDRAVLRARLDQGAEQADAILTSGGASAGDEDHVSALLNEAGAMRTWRIAVKPGRPLALGLWRGRPVFGLPGNPVAAMVCTLIFARPALGQLAGADWSEPVGIEVPAGFEKRKKPGRREYLRARLRDGRAEVFASEGSGRISGLSWAEGLVELEDGERHIRPGDPVRFLPYAEFGI